MVAARLIGVGLSAIRALAARHGLHDLGLFTGTGVLDKMPDKDDARVAGVGAQTLKARVVGLYGFVFLGRWVRVRCARLLCGHEVPLRGPGPGRVLAAAGPSLCHVSIVSSFLEKCNSYQYNFLVILSRLKEHRERRGLTQMELAKLSDVGRATIAAIETGKRPRPHPTTRQRLARALKVKPEKLA